MWLDSAVRPPVRLHSPLFLHSKKAAPARFCTYLFLDTGGEDVSRDITNDNVGVISGQRNHGGSWFSFTIIQYSEERSFNACFNARCLY